MRAELARGLVLGMAGMSPRYDISAGGACPGADRWQPGQEQACSHLEAAEQENGGAGMKWALTIIVVLCVLGIGGYVYSKCPDLNNCFANPVCEHDCYENGVRVK
jgi:hypothetical protein